jgi:hypothetical protein
MSKENYLEYFGFELIHHIKLNVNSNYVKYKTNR